MDIRERWEDHLEALHVAMRSHQARMWTSLPGSIVDFNADLCTATVQPGILGTVTAQDGSQTNPKLPLIPDVPVYFPAGGGCTLTFPVQKGDECWLVFSSRNIDSWWQSGGQQMPMDGRMHDLSDPACYVGVRSKANKLPAAVSSDGAQLRSNDGSTFVQLSAANQIVTVTAPGGTVFNGPVTMNETLEVKQAVTLDENLTVKGDASVGDVTSVVNHTHLNSGGSGTGGPPSPGT